MKPKINLTDLRWYCNEADLNVMTRAGGNIGGYKESEYMYKDNGSPVLAVAHCDFNLKDNRLYEVYDIIDDYAIVSPHLDDRLGVYTILEVLPKMDINVDILLTRGEERGCSTAQFFNPIKQYNWIVEFDRRGCDAVTYDYEGDGWDELVNTHFDLGFGSFSDISFMEHLNTKAFNVGIGYQKEHSIDCYFKVSDYTNQIMRFSRFYKDNVGKRCSHTSSPKRHKDNWVNYCGRICAGAFECLDCGQIFMEGDAIKSELGIKCPTCGSYLNDQYKDQFDMENPYEYYSPQYIAALAKQQGLSIP